MIKCASQLGDLGDLKRQFNNYFVEPAVELHYCSEMGGCIPYPGIPGIVVPTDFFDVISGRNVCNDIAGFLKIYNPGLDDSLMRIQCKAPNPNPWDNFAIPDMITHKPLRKEFYEVKPLSTSGTSEGRLKIKKFKIQCTDYRITEYAPGTDYRPNQERDLPITTWLGMPFKLRWSFAWSEAGLIQWDICAETNLEIVGEAAWKGAITRAVIALLFLAPELAPLLILARNTVEEDSGTLFGLAGSVGNGGANDPADVRGVQLLLNSWRAQNGLAAIAVDGATGGQTISAINQFQSDALGFPSPDSLVEPTKKSIRELERAHLRVLTADDEPPQPDEATLAVLLQASPRNLEIQTLPEESPLEPVAQVGFESAIRSYFAEIRLG